MISPFDITVYTAITGDRDYPRTDSAKVFQGRNLLEDPRREARMYKALSHFFVFTEYCIWVDANIYLKVSPEYLVETFLKDHDVAAMYHPYRDNIYSEGKECVILGLDKPEIIQEQMENNPGHIMKGLWATGVLLRRHTEDIRRKNERWWAEICRYSVRDQLSFPYVFENINTIPGHYLNHDLFEYRPHKK